MAIDVTLRRIGIAEMLAEAEALIAAGPPNGLRVSKAAWYRWVLSKEATCPANPSGEPCRKPACALGTKCAAHLAEIGLAPSGEPLRRKERPACGARTRAGGECAVKAEPGSKRCRFHGGLSTGPKTEAGRQRIAEAQSKRWARYYLDQMSRSTGTG